MTTFEFIKKHKFIAILRHIELKYIEAAAKALYDGGVRVFEVTFNPAVETTAEETKSIISKIYSMFGDEVCIGAGTVLTVPYAEAAFEAGARFIVSPCTDESVMAYTKSKGMLSMPGAYTPTEIVRAYNLGADIVKIFPILPDGDAYLKTLVSPLPHIPFAVTGGINPDTAGKFIKAGAAAVAAGASLVTADLCENGEFEKITELARRHIEKVRQWD